MSIKEWYKLILEVTEFEKFMLQINSLIERSNKGTV